MKKLFLIPFLGTALLFSCNNSTENSDNKQQNSDSVEQVAYEKEAIEQTTISTDAPTTITIQTFDKATLSEREIGLYEVELKGNIVAGARWEDKNGGNIVYFTEGVTITPESDDAPEAAEKELHAYHYKYNSGKYELVREVEDYERDCIFDNRARFMEESVSVTDLDNDGFAELTFVYRLGCTSELSPDGLKLIMLENGEKYAIRGNTVVNYGTEKVGGETNLDPSFDEAPTEFLDYAKQIWVKNQDQSLAYKARKYMIDILLQYKDAKIGGVEPFWTIKINKENCVYSAPGIGELKFEYSKIRNLPNGFDVQAVRYEGEATAYLKFTITEENCNDGMSDNVYPLKIEGKLNSQKLYGCGRRNSLALHPTKEIKLTNHSIAITEVYNTLDNIKLALMADDAERLSKSVLFPLRINGSNKMSITDAKMLAAKYDEVFTPKLKQKILDINYNTLGDNSNGIFPDGGLVWLTTKNNKAKLFVVNAR